MYMKGAFFERARARGDGVPIESTPPRGGAPGGPDNRGFVTRVNYCKKMHGLPRARVITPWHSGTKKMGTPGSAKAGAHWARSNFIFYGR